MCQNSYNNVINYPFIDYIIKSYVPEIQKDKSNRKIDMNIFKESMFHQSTKCNNDDITYERLEYLGDAFFHLAITEYLYIRYDDENEGFLTKLRIRLERGDSMVELTKILELDNYVQIYNISLNDHILEDIFEAFIGAFYLNFNTKYSKTFVAKLVEKHKNLSEIINHDDNYKDLLLRYFHQMKWGHPIYEYEPTFQDRKKISIVKNPFGKVLGKGISNSKKKAEQIASKKALIALSVIVNGEIDINWSGKIEKIEKDVKEKEKIDKKSMSVFNTDNKLIKRSNIKKILSIYNIVIPKNITINIRLFQEAMTHRSYLVRNKLTEKDKIASLSCVKLQKKSNERLQFLGDAVIHFVIAEYLYHKYPKADEGFLTRLRCRLENRESLFYLAKQTNIGSYVLVSQNIEVLHGRTNVNIIGGGFEAFVGALYLETGMIITKEFILAVIRIELDISQIAHNETNYKGLILQMYLENHWGHPDYKILKEEGPAHCKMFTVGIYLNGKLIDYGRARSKKKAEQIASKKMYLKFTEQKNSPNLI